MLTISKLRISLSMKTLNINEKSEDNKMANRKMIFVTASLAMD